MARIQIRLTDEQKKHIRAESGVEVEALNVETLEDRDAPKGGRGTVHRVFPQINNPAGTMDLPILNDPTLE